MHVKPNFSWYLVLIRFIYQHQKTYKYKYLQDWNYQHQQMSKLRDYNNFTHFICEKYLFLSSSSSSRLGSHGLLCETCRCHKIPYENRICKLCQMQVVENEYHFVLVCRLYGDFRQYYLPIFYNTRPNMRKFLSNYVFH